MSEESPLYKCVFEKDVLSIEDYLQVKTELFTIPGALSEFNAKLSQLAPSRKKQEECKRGIFYWVSGKSKEACEILEELEYNEQARYFYGRSLLDNQRYQEAAVVFGELVTQSPEVPFFVMARSEALSQEGHPEEALEFLEQYGAKFDQLASYHYQVGFAHELSGDYEQALEQYHVALERQPDYIPALFRLAYQYDLRGEDQQAIELYEKCVQAGPLYTNALINLGILYEDHNEYHKAMNCYFEILEIYPHHKRANLYLKDAQSSLSMVVDEETERQKDKRNQILSTPITDFELSVRSRNCLNKMKIMTLGDLTQKTEAELLSYKNFGETSLAEIKEVLSKKGLKLGMNQKEEPQKGMEVKSLKHPSAEGEVLSKPISQLELSVRSRKCLNLMNVKTIGDLIEKTESELLACKNFGQTSMMEIKQKLADYGVKLREG